MKAAQKYLALLERDCEFLALKLVEARKDIEFYRAKVERLELAITQTGLTPAQIYTAQQQQALRCAIKSRCNLARRTCRFRN